jgi:M6 family metalloprotease-like protein
MLAVILIVPVSLADNAYSLAIAPVHAYTGPYAVSPIGEQKTIVVLVEFADIKHAHTFSYLEGLVFRDLNNYYGNVSYGKTWLSGRIHSKWYQLPRPISSYAWDGKRDLDTHFWPFITEILTVADADIDFSHYNRLIIFHAGTWNQLGNVSFFTDVANFTTNDGARIHHVQVNSSYDTWIVVAHEFGHNIAHLKDLYGISIDSTGRQVWNFTKYVGPWDVMSNDYYYNTPAFSAWSRIKLGWLEPKNIMVGREMTLDLSPLAVASNSTQVLKVPLTSTVYYLIEARFRIGPYEVNLPDSGILITVANDTRESGQGPLVVVNPFPEETGRSRIDQSTFDLRQGKISWFLDERNDIGVVVLWRLDHWYRVAVTTVAKARSLLKNRERAFLAVNAIDQADAAVVSANAEGRTEGLYEARQMLEQAKSAVRTEAYEQAAMLGLNAKQIAEKSNYPKLYYEAKEALTALDQEVSHELRFSSSEANSLLEQVVKSREKAKQNFADKNWQGALSEARAALTLLQKAKQIEEQYQSEQRNFVIVVGLILLIVVITVLKRRERRYWQSIRCELTDERGSSSSFLRLSLNATHKALICSSSRS